MSELSSTDEQRLANILSELTDGVHQLHDFGARGSYLRSEIRKSTGCDGRKRLSHERLEVVNCRFVGEFDLHAQSLLDGRGRVRWGCRQSLVGVAHNESRSIPFGVPMPSAFRPVKIPVGER